MALIECPECGREVSSSAAACPACAYPLQRETPPKRQWWKTTISIVGRLTAATFLVGSGISDTPWIMAQGAVIGGLIIGASALLVFHRDRIERLKAGRAAATLDDRVADRMREDIRQVDQMHAAQIAELEERVDFAERLLTKQREQIGPG